MSPAAVSMADREVSGDAAGRPRPVWARLAAFGLGVALLCLAVWVLSGQREAIDRARAAAASAPTWRVVAVAALPLVNFACSAGTFWVLTNRYGRVRGLEMAALMCSAWLLNQLPLRPGLVGRVAYHRVVNRIAVRNSLKVLVAAIGCTGAALAVLLGAAVAAAVLPRPLALTVLVLPAPLLAAVAIVARAKGGGVDQSWRWPAAVAWRYADMQAWLARYALLFAVLGWPVTLSGAAAVTVTAQAAQMMPVQIGLREWAVGLTGGLLLSGGGEEAGALEAAAPGLIVDLVNRVAELLWAVPLGAVATAVLYRRWRRVRTGRPPVNGL